MKARIVRIGNSQGIRIPKVFLEQAQLGEEVELIVEGEAIIIRAARAARAGWAEAFRSMAEAADDALLDEPAPTRFDRHDWTW